MAEKQLIKQLKGLNMIKPNNDWAVLAKERILKPELKMEESHSIFQWIWMKEHGALVASLAGVMIIFGFFFGSQFLNLGNTPGVIVDGRGLTESLGNLEASMNIITKELNSVQKAQDALAIREAVASAIERSEKIIAQAKSSKIKEDTSVDPISGNAIQPTKQEVLSALSGAEDALSAMKQTSEQVQKEIAEREINELKTNILTERQTKLLAEADKALKAGDYVKALEKIIEIPQLNLE